MIIGKSYVECGTGDVGVLGTMCDDYGVLIIKEIEPRAIGSLHTPNYEKEGHDSSIIMRFASQESIDSVIEQLMQMKRCMRHGIEIDANDTRTCLNQLIEEVKQNK